jgi:hypothetical protein
MRLRKEKPRRTVYRFEVPVDDKTHEFELSPQGKWADISKVENVRIDRIEFWAELDLDNLVTRRFQVIGTGHLAPEDGWYIGTAPRNPAGLVWHLYEVPHRREL